MVLAYVNSTFVFIDSGMKINDEYYQKIIFLRSAEALGRQTFRTQIMNIPTELSIVALCSRLSRMAEKKVPYFTFCGTMPIEIS